MLDKAIAFIMGGYLCLLFVAFLGAIWGIWCCKDVLRSWIERGMKDAD